MNAATRKCISRPHDWIDDVLVLIATSNTPLILLASLSAFLLTLTHGHSDLDKMKCLMHRCTLCSNNCPVLATTLDHKSLNWNLESKLLLYDCGLLPLLVVVLIIIIG